MGGWIVPGGVPLASVAPEVVLGIGGSVAPWFAASAVWEEPVGASNSHVEHQVEFLVERGLLSLAIPDVFAAEVALGPHVRVEGGHQHGLAVDGRLYSAFVPFEAVDVEVVGEVVRVLVALGSLSIGVMVICRPPVESGSKSVKATSVVSS